MVRQGDGVEPKTNEVINSIGALTSKAFDSNLLRHTKVFVSQLSTIFAVNLFLCSLVLRH